MRFSFRLETLMKQRRVERDIAQREYSDAQSAVNQQMTYIKHLYSEIDNARLESENTHQRGGECAHVLQQLEEYINGQKVRVQSARQKARELMQVAEERLEILVEKNQGLKVLEKLKEKKHQEFKKSVKKKEAKILDDIVTMSFESKR